MEPSGGGGGEIPLILAFSPTGGDGVRKVYEGNGLDHS